MTIRHAHSGGSQIYGKDNDADNEADAVVREMLACTQESPVAHRGGDYNAYTAVSRVACGTYRKEDTFEDERNGANQGGNNVYCCRATQMTPIGPRRSA